MIAASIKLYPEPVRIYQGHQAVTKYSRPPTFVSTVPYALKELEDLRDEAISRGLVIGQRREHTIRSEVLEIADYTLDPKKIFQINGEPTNIQCRRIDKNGTIGPILSYGFSIHELLTDYDLLEDTTYEAEVIPCS